MKTIICIDPGANGGIAVKAELGTPLAYAMPETEGDLLNLLESHCDASRFEDSNAEIICVLEDIVKFAGRNMPSSAMATYASNWGFIKGAAMALRMRLELIRPKSWQKTLGLGVATGMSKTEWKNKLKAEAQRLYPQIKVTLATADALLILEAKLRSNTP